MLDQVYPPTLSRRAFAILFASSLIMAIANTGLMSLLPVIGRSLAIPDTMVTSVFVFSALMWAAFTPFWTKAADRMDRKTLIMISLTGIVFAKLLMGLVVTAGLLHMASPMVILALLVVSRGCFGALGSASTPATQAIIGEGTRPEDRTQAMANLAGAFGLGTVVGPFFAPLFVLPIVGLAGPLYVFSLMGVAALVVTWRYLGKSLPPPLPVRTADGEPQKRVRIWRDPRVTPFLWYSLLTAACQSSIGLTLGFLVIDKLAIEPVASQGFIALAMMFGALSGLLGQWGLIRMFQMTPRHLLRWGVALAALGNLIVAVAPNYWSVVVGFAVACLGFAFARPGAAAGSSLAVELHEQARVGGAFSIVGVMTMTVAPVYVMLYERVHWAPFAVNVVMMLGLLVYAYTNTQLRNADPKPTSRLETVLATVERNDSGGV
ncbi:MFS transporter [Phenylobacterium sp.]|uniref:MFS transporter n=1 Tax=Phenylobacterium sp. TaxID=1871053 RepID=UPI002733F2BE|nr:MFS transporter [Phenylobacterium sp.]MDP3659780.1 MFS transporter [Phenylobacterium sp.]